MLDVIRLDGTPPQKLRHILISIFSLALNLPCVCVFLFLCMKHKTWKSSPRQTWFRRAEDAAAVWQQGYGFWAPVMKDYCMCHPGKGPLPCLSVCLYVCLSGQPAGLSPITQNESIPRIASLCSKELKELIKSWIVTHPLHSRTGKVTLVRQKLNHFSLRGFFSSSLPLFFFFQHQHRSAHFCTARKQWLKSEKQQSPAQSHAAAAQFPRVTANCQWYTEQERGLTKMSRETG